MSARARAVEILKSILIVLLMGTMSLLFLLTWSTDSSVLPDSVRSVADGVNRIFGGTVYIEPTVVGSRADTYGDAVQLRAIAVSDDGVLEGFYPPSDEADELYARLSLTLADCLGSAEGAAEVGREDFLRAMQSSGSVSVLYTDAQPLSLLALGQGVTIGIDDVSVRELVLARGSRHIFLFLSDGTSFIRAVTAVERETLDAVTADAVGERSALSSDLGFADDAPIAVYPAGELRRPVAVSAPSAVGETAVNDLLAAFGMNTETNYRYVSADGTQYAVEGERTLAVSADGVVTYVAGDGEGASLRADATDAAAIEFCRAIVADGAEPLIGDADLSLRSFERNGSRIEVTFGYTLGGAAVYHGGRDGCAVLTVEDGVLTSARLMLRHYALATDEALMMPPESAAVLGAGEPAYFDDGDGELTPIWSK